MSFQVKVVDANKKPATAITDAKVALVQRDATNEKLDGWPYAGIAANCTHKADGVYAPATDPAAGQWLLVVSKSGKSPVVQRLTIAASTLTVSAGWDKASAPPADANKKAATVSLASTAVTAKSTTKAISATVSVRMFDAREEVYQNGLEYDHAGTNWYIFNDIRRRARYEDKAIDDGTIVHQLKIDKDVHDTFVKGADGWVLVGQKTFPAGKSSIVDFYKALDAIGKRAPGTVKEASIISHAWPGGPILRNTYDRASGDARDANDSDGRIKDWKSATQSTVPDLKKAFHADAYLKVWGCSATTYHRVAISGAYPKAKAGAAETDVIEVAWQFFDHSRPPKLTGSNRARLTLAHVRHMIATQCSGKSYASAAAKFLGLPVWGAPPGLGSNFAGRPLKVDTNGAVFGYLKVLFGDAAGTPDADGYFDYKKITAAIDAKPALLAEPAWTTERWETEEDVENRFLALTIATGLQVYGPKPAGSTLRWTSAAAAVGLVDAGKKGTLHSCNGSKPKEWRDHGGTCYGVGIGAEVGRDTGVLVQEDGKVYLLVRTKTDKAWKKETEKVPQLKYDRAAGAWVPDGAALKDHGGLIQSVAPKFYF